MVVSYSNFYAHYENKVGIYLRRTITVLENKNMKNLAKILAIAYFANFLLYFGLYH